MLALIGKFVMNLLRWIDEGGNALTLGDPDETISERAARASIAGKGWGCLLCKLLDWIVPNHCANALKRAIGQDAIIPDPPSKE